MEEWGIQFGTEAYDEPSKVVLDSDDNIYVVGTTKDASDILCERSRASPTVVLKECVRYSAV